MKNKGFYIKSIIATGKEMILSRVDFVRGCNLLFGPTDSGKSSVFSVMEFLLGKTYSKKSVTPKAVVESRGYDTYYMEIVTEGDNAIHTIRRFAKENSVFVKDCSFEQFDTFGHAGKSYPISSRDKTTYSDYLMELNGFEEQLEIRTGPKDKKRMTYSLIRHLVLTDENRIISENPIFNPTGQRLDVQTEKSLIYYLTTGNDDSAFEKSEKDAIRKSRYVGMISLTEEEIELVKQRIEKLGDVSFADFNDNGAIKALEMQLNDEEQRLNLLYIKRKELEEKYRKQESKKLFNTEFVKRMKMLQSHYETDLSRYEYLFEGASLFAMLASEKECPICHSVIASKEALDEEYLEAIQKEYDKLKAKIGDVINVIAKKNQQIENQSRQIFETERALAQTEEKIGTFASQLSSIKETLAKYQKNIEKKAESELLYSELGRLTRKLDQLNKDEKHKPAEKPYIRQTDIKEDFCKSLKQKLVAWNVLSENENVVFDENAFDFILGVKERLTCGKGTRGVTCSAILMTLVEYCYKKDIPFSNYLVLDSPITAHYNDKKVVLDETTQSRFFKYCNETTFDYQLIIIDNKAPDDTMRKKLNNIHYVEFTDDNGFYQGRKE